MPIPRIRTASLALVVTTASSAVAPVCGNGDRKPALPESTAAALAPIATLPSTDGPSSSINRATFSSPPVADSEGMVFPGVIWIDGAPVTGEAIACINGVECGRGHTVNMVDGGPFFSIGIESDAVRSGCGVRGALVTFTINGRVADTTAVWAPGLQPNRDLVIGPRSAQYWGEISFDAPFRESGAVPTHVVPYVGDVVCGYQLNPMQGDGEVGYQILVLPEELRPGCGRPSTPVTLRLEGTIGGGWFDVFLQTITWEPGPLLHLPDVRLGDEGLTAPAP